MRITNGNLGPVLRKVRLAAELSQRDLSAALGCSREWVSRVERGERVPLGTVLRWLDECGAALEVVGGVE